MEIILDNDYDDRFYAIEKSTNNTFYVVKKDTQSNPDSAILEMMNYEDTEVSFDSEGLLTYAKRSKPVLPNFWIILKVQDGIENQIGNNPECNTTTIIVNVYFHCR